MLSLYRFMSKRMDQENAIFCSLITNIIAWFLIGAILGIMIALLFVKTDMVISYAITIGSLASLIIGYVGGYIQLIHMCK